VTHERARELLPDVVLGLADAALLRHVAGCHACQRQVFLLHRVDAALRERRSPRGPASRLRRRAAPLAALAVAVAALALFVPARPPRPAFALRADGGRIVARATLAASGRVALEADGLPAGDGSAYALWAGRGEGGQRILVGRFMADPRGFCRVSFDVPDAGRWVRFWITPAADRVRVVAAT
jgi:hypothetical protein